ncbi:hypothetical protein FACS189459_0540 [Bacilli bacterium]|nr:hypothetical protein FACS189459_0540 [Bacilli bacterium]
MKYNPVSISCTFSANGGSKDTTLNVLKIIKSYNVKTISHFACANRSIEDVKNYFDELVNLNINNVLILQGDKPTATDPFKYASDLMHYINNKYNGFFIFQGAFYPEKHNENKTCDYDIEIKRTILNKYNAGCRTFISQSIFDVDIYFDSISQIKKQFNDITLLPGILPITRHAMVERAITLCGCTIKQE